MRAAELAAILALALAVRCMDAVEVTEEVVDVVVALAPGAPEEHFSIAVHAAWAPVGAGRFLELVDAGHFDDCAFFRVIDRFMAQVGISGNVTRQGAWRERAIADETTPAARRASNTRGRVTFAHAGPNSRSTQLFINFGNNARLDRENFPPFGEIDANVLATYCATTPI